MNPQLVPVTSFSSLNNEPVDVLHGRRVILSTKLSKIRYLVPMWKRDQIIRGRIRCPIRVSVNFGFYPELVSHHFSNLIGPISIGILPMRWLRIRYLLVSFHVSVWRTICGPPGCCPPICCPPTCCPRFIGWLGIP